MESGIPKKKFMSKDFKITFSIIICDDSNPKTELILTKPNDKKTLNSFLGVEKPATKSTNMC